MPNPSEEANGTDHERNLLCQSMNVHDRSVSRTNNVFVVEDDELSLELGDGVNGGLRRGEDETDADILVFNSAQSYTNVVTAHGERNLVFHLIVDRGYADRSLGERGNV